MPDSNQPPTKGDLRDLGKAIGANTEALQPLIEDFEDLKKATRTNRILSLLLVLALLVVGFQIWQNRRDLDDREGDARQTCLNSNERTKVTLNLWLGIIDAPQDPNAPPRTPQQQRDIDDLRAYVEDGYALRDCNDLSEEYKAPKFPRLGD